MGLHLVGRILDASLLRHRDHRRRRDPRRRGNLRRCGGSPRRRRAHESPQSGQSRSDGHQLGKTDEKQHRDERKDSPPASRPQTRPAVRGDDRPVRTSEHADAHPPFLARNQTPRFVAAQSIDVEDILAALPTKAHPFVPGHRLPGHRARRRDLDPVHRVTRRVEAVRGPHGPSDARPWEKIWPEGPSTGVRSRAARPCAGSRCRRHWPSRSGRAAWREPSARRARSTPGGCRE